MSNNADNIRRKVQKFRPEQGYDQTMSAPGTRVTQ